MSKYIPKQYISGFNPCDISKNETILGNDKSDIIKTFNKALLNRNIFDSINNAIELHVSGYFDTVLSKLQSIYFNDINLANIHGLNFIHNFTKYYIEKYNYKIKKNHPIIIVNDQIIRNFISFFITFILTSNQRKLPKLPKISSDDFNLTNKKKTLVSTNLSLLARFINKNDPKEIIIPLSEICHYFKIEQLNNREHKILYWLSWLFEYEKLFHKNNLIVNNRNVPNIDIKYQKDFIWIVWDIIKHYSSQDILPHINKLFDLYTIQYTRGSKRSKSNLIVNAILLVINPIPKIKVPIEPITSEQYIKCAYNSLKCNNIYLKLFQKKIINNV